MSVLVLVPAPLRSLVPQELTAPTAQLMVLKDEIKDKDKVRKRRASDEAEVEADDREAQSSHPRVPVGYPPLPPSQRLLLTLPLLPVLEVLKKAGGAGVAFKRIEESQV
eukprot:749276-Hanusia_phi.AAC.5